MTATIYSAVYVVLLRHVKAQESPGDAEDFSFFFFLQKSVISTAATAKIYREKREVSGIAINFFPSKSRLCLTMSGMYLSK